MKKNSFLLVIIFLIILSSCASEQDTRLVCDCDYIKIDNQKIMCSDSYNFDNNSLVFNESKKKFVWNSRNVSGGPDWFMEFNKDTISYRFNTELKKTYKRFDRVNLVYSEHIQKVDKFIVKDKFDRTPIWKPGESTFYKCRVVDGV